MTGLPTFDPIWEQLRNEGRNVDRYPWDVIVSFVYRYAPHDKARSEINILKVGCGGGNNLWFAAREGFQVSGIDGSPTAIAYARQRFAEDGLYCDLRVGDFTQIPFESNRFDLVIDRASITCCGLSTAKKAVSEVRRVLRTGGKFHFNPYSNLHSSYVSGRHGPDGLILDISAGTLVGVGQICFYGRSEIDALFTEGRELLTVQHMAIVEQVQPQFTEHAEWLVIAEKR